MIDLNCRGLVDMTHAALPYMGRGAHIVQVASAAAFVPLPHMNVYAATKAFVLRYTRALRWELHGTGITATALCPTWVKTGFEKVARESGGGSDVHHLLGAQKASTVVSRALRANRLHMAVATASPQSCALRIIGKVVPNCISMAAGSLCAAFRRRGEGDVMNLYETPVNSAADVQDIIDEIGTYFRTGVTLSVDFRIRQLNRLGAYLREHEQGGARGAPCRPGQECLRVLRHRARSRL